MSNAAVLDGWKTFSLRVFRKIVQEVQEVELVTYRISKSHTWLDDDIYRSATGYWDPPHPLAFL